MAATLPPINAKSGAKKMPAYANFGSYRPGQQSGTMNFEEMEEKRQRLQSLQRDLTRIDTALFRHSYRHSLCLDMLKDGFHLSFRELFNLIHQQLMEREAAGPESIMWTQVMLQDEHEKLNMLKRLLINAETAQRLGDSKEVYKNRYELAIYFQSTGDKWLADHFFKTCLQTAEGIDSDGGKTKAQGHCNVGVVLEENGDIYTAAEHFEEYYKLSEDRDMEWFKEDDRGNTISFLVDACIHLCQIYTAIGKKLQADEPERCVEYLEKAFAKAKESKDRKLERETAYILGLAYEINGNVDIALLHLNNFYASCKAANDKEGMGRACDAIAKAYAREGRKEQSVEYLKHFVETAEESGMDLELSKACHNLGNIFNSMGKYKEAGEYFNRAYNISRALGETSSIQVNRVQSGIAQAHSMLRQFSAHVVQGDRTCLHRIIEWKNVRQNLFNDVIPDPSILQEMYTSDFQESEIAVGDEVTQDKTEGEGNNEVVSTN